MANKTPAEKMAIPVIVRPVKNDPDRLHMSKTDVIAKNKKLKEIESKLEVERKKLEDQYEKEQEILENIGKEELESSMKKRNVKKSVEEE